MYLLKLNSSFSKSEYVTTATRLLTGKILKYSIKLSTNVFSRSKTLEPILPDLSMTKTKSNLGEDTEKSKLKIINRGECNFALLVNVSNRWHRKCEPFADFKKVNHADLYEMPPFLFINL